MKLSVFEFDFNGKLLMLGGVSSWHWLFALVLMMVSVKALHCFIKKWRAERTAGKPFWTFLK